MTDYLEIGHASPLPPNYGHCDCIAYLFPWEGVSYHRNRSGAIASLGAYLGFKSPMFVEIPPDKREPLDLPVLYDAWGFQEGIVPSDVLSFQKDGTPVYSHPDYKIARGVAAYHCQTIRHATTLSMAHPSHEIPWRFPYGCVIEEITFGRYKAPLVEGMLGRILKEEDVLFGRFASPDDEPKGFSGVMEMAEFSLNACLIWQAVRAEAKEEGCEFSPELARPLVEALAAGVPMADILPEG